MPFEKQPEVRLTNEQEPLAEDWQAMVEGLQNVVCLLLIKNQTMRVALSAERGDDKLEQFF